MHVIMQLVSEIQSLYQTTLAGKNAFLQVMVKTDSVTLTAKIVTCDVADNSVE